MKRRWMAGALAALTLVQTPAWAQMLDLPNPGDFGGTDTPAPLAPPVQEPEQPKPAPSPTTLKTQYSGFITIYGVSRKSGGTLYRLELQQALPLSRLDLRVAASQMKVSAVNIITVSGQRLDVRDLRSDEVLAAGTMKSTSTLNTQERIAAIEFTAESFNLEADITLTVCSDKEVPKLAWKRNPPSTPVADEHQRRGALTYRRPVREGDRVFVIERDSAQAVVLGKDNGGGYILRFLTGELAGRAGGGWQRNSLAVMDGCNESLCVGDTVYNLSRELAQVRIVGLQTDGNVVLQFLDGSLAGRIGGNWGVNDLTTTKSRGKNFGVGDKVYLFDEGREPALVQIIAVERTGNYTVYFIQGEVAGRRGNNWTEQNFARVSGCGKNYCVGDIVTNISRDYLRVQIVGVQMNGRYVLRFLEGNIAGRLGNNWGDEDLRKFRY